MSFWEKGFTTCCVTYEEVLDHFFDKRIADVGDFDLNKNYFEYDGVSVELFPEDEFTDILEKEILNNYNFHGYDEDDVKNCGIISDIADNIDAYEDKKEVQEYIDDNIEDYINDAY